MASAVVETAGPAGGAHSGAATVLERREILKALRLLRRGDFSVRLPLDLAGIDGEIACAFNEVVELNDAMTRDVRARQCHGRARRHDLGAHARARRRRLLGAMRRFDQPAGRRHVVPGLGSRARDRRGGERQPRAVHEPRSRRPSGARRIPAHQQRREHDGRPARLVCFRSDTRRARSGHRRQARRPGARGRRRRHLEGSHRFRQSHGREPHRPGAQHRRGDDRDRERQPLQENHRRRQGRDPRAEEHHQHDGGPAQLASPPK